MGRALTLTIAEPAEADLLDLWDHLAERTSPDRADAQLKRIRDRLRRLLDFPEIGPPRDHLAPGLRAQFHGRHVAYYRVTDDAVIVVAMLHGARDATAALRGR